jgi:serralysin
VPAVASTSLTGNPYIDGVLSSTRWAVNNLSFSFPSNGAFYGTGYGEGENVNNFGVLSAQQQSAVRSVLAMYASVANLSFAEFTETAGTHADLRFGMSNDPSTAWAYLPATYAEGGDVWFNRSGGQYNAPTNGNYAYATIIHEIGHALGLDHAHQGNAVPADRDSMEYTVMSYRSYVGASTSTGYTNESWGYAQSLMMYDIAAIQHMYGANFASNATNTIYSWSPITGEMFINGVGQGAPGGNRIFQTVWDGNGNDTYNFSNYSTDLRINLQPGEWTTTSSAQLARLHYNGSQIADGNIANALLYNGDLRSLIENAIGGSGHDIMIGNVANNTLTGLAGDDYMLGQTGDDCFYSGPGRNTVDGGVGTDAAMYDWCSAGIAVSLPWARASGIDFIDDLVSIEWVLGSSYADVLIGRNDARERFDGGLGNDEIYTYGLDDVLAGGPGVNILDGGIGLDTVTYVWSPTGISASLPWGSVTGPGFADQLLGIECLVGSNWSDVILGRNGIADWLEGGGGNDEIYGYTGADRIVGDHGNDLLSGGADADVFAFLLGFGRDVITDFQATGAAHDVIEFSRSVFANFSAVQARSVQSGANVTITYDAQNSITLQNVALANLDSSDFFFV